jgi:hypothetical protein
MREAYKMPLLAYIYDLEALLKRFLELVIGDVAKWDELDIGHPISCQLDTSIDTSGFFEDLVHKLIWKILHY